MNAARIGTKAAAHYALDVPAGGSTTVRLRLSADRSDGCLRRFREGLRQPHRRGRRVLPADHAEVAHRGSASRPPPGAWPACCGASSTTTSTSIAGCASTSSHPLQARPLPRRAEHGMVPHAQRRRDLHARQVGVPVVRGVGPGLPHDRRWRWSISTSPRSSCC